MNSILRTFEHCAFRSLGFGGGILLSSLLLVSCAHTKKYSEPALPEGEAAFLEANIPVWIVTVDGLRVSTFGLKDRKQLRIAPGSHVVTVAYAQETSYVGVMPPAERLGFPSPPDIGEWLSQPGTVRASSQEVELDFVAECGRTYVVSARVEGVHWMPKIAEHENHDR
jgi:hypothetical protein